MKISVVIPSYNHGHYLPECLDAILAQSRLPDEIIVIDDASTDHTQEILKRHQAKIPFLKTFRNLKNSGVNVSMNRGVREASGDWTTLTAADDKILPGFFESCANVVQAHPEIGICYGDMSTFTDRDPNHLTLLPSLPFSIPTIFSPEETVELCRSRGLIVRSPAALYRRDLLLQYGPYEDSLKSLTDFFLNCRITFKHPIAYIPRLFSAYRLVPHSYGASIRSNFSLRSEMFQALQECILKKEDDAFRKNFKRSRAIAGCGYFYLLFLVLRPYYWPQLISAAPSILREKFLRLFVY